MNNILLIILATALALALYPLIRSVTEDIAAADAALTEIREKVRDVHTSGSDTIDLTGNELRKTILDYGNLRSLAVFGPDRLLVYAYSANPHLIRIMEAEEIRLDAVDFVTRPVFDRIISAGSPGNDDYYMEGVFEVLDYGDVYRVAVILFVFLLIFTVALFFTLLKLSGNVSRESSSENKQSPSNKRYSEEAPAHQGAPSP